MIKLNWNIMTCLQCDTKLRQYFVHPDGKIFKRCSCCLRVHEIVLKK